MGTIQIKKVARTVTIGKQDAPTTVIVLFYSRCKKNREKSHYFRNIH